MTKHYIYRFHAELRDYKPRLWRRFEINGEKTMAELAYALMIMFEMQANHFFSISVNTREWFQASVAKINERLGFPTDDDDLGDSLPRITRFELPDESFFVAEDEEVIAADSIRLKEVTREAGWQGVFEYDHGDGWEVDLRLESCESYEDISIAGYPRVLEGEGFGIIEDVGGPGGLEHLAKVLKKGKGKEYQECCEWLGTTELDLASFDKEEMNFRLKKLLRVYRDIYQKQLPPTEKSYAILLRENNGKPGK